MCKGILVISLLIAFSCSAERILVFTQGTSNQTVEMRIGHRATILYKGYLGQVEVARETVTNITDSTIVLGINYAEVMGTRPGKKLRTTSKVIRISDIIGFRRMTLGRQLGTLAFRTAGIVGSFYLLRGVYANPSISPGVAFLISLSTGFGILGLNTLLFPENIKYYMEDGWSVSVKTR